MLRTTRDGIDRWRNENRCRITIYDETWFVQAHSIGSSSFNRAPTKFSFQRMKFYCTDLLLRRTTNSPRISIELIVKRYHPGQSCSFFVESISRPAYLEEIKQLRGRTKINLVYVMLNRRGGDTGVQGTASFMEDRYPYFPTLLVTFVCPYLTPSPYTFRSLFPVGSLALPEPLSPFVDGGERGLYYRRRNEKLRTFDRSASLLLHEKGRVRREAPPGTKPLRRKTVGLGTTAFAILLVRPVSSSLLPTRRKATGAADLPMFATS